MEIRDPRLTVQPSGDDAIVTITFTVVLLQQDLTMRGGFLEAVGLSPSPSTSGPLTHSLRALPIDDAIKPTPTATHEELYREHTFRVPRHPQGPFTTVRFNGYVDITPAVKFDDHKVTAEGVLPAKYSLRSAIQALSSRIRDLIAG
jgi:hypothetical protein